MEPIVYGKLSPDDFAAHRIQLHEYRAVGDDGVTRQIKFDPPLTVDPGDCAHGPDYLIVAGTRYDLEPIQHSAEGEAPETKEG